MHKFHAQDAFDFDRHLYRMNTGPEGPSGDADDAPKQPMSLENKVDMQQRLAEAKARFESKMAEKRDRDHNELVDRLADDATADSFLDEGAWDDDLDAEIDDWEMDVDDVEQKPEGVVVVGGDRIEGTGDEDVDNILGVLDDYGVSSNLDAGMSPLDLAIAKGRAAKMTREGVTDDEYDQPTNTLGYTDDEADGMITRYKAKQEAAARMNAGPAQNPDDFVDDSDWNEGDRNEFARGLIGDLKAMDKPEDAIGMSDDDEWMDVPAELDGSTVLGYQNVPEGTIKGFGSAFEWMEANKVSIQVLSNGDMYVWNNNHADVDLTEVLNGRESDPGVMTATNIIGKNVSVYLGDGGELRIRVDSGDGMHTYYAKNTQTESHQTVVKAEPKKKRRWFGRGQNKDVA